MWLWSSVTASARFLRSLVQTLSPSMLVPGKCHNIFTSLSRISCEQYFPSKILKKGSIRLRINIQICRCHITIVKSLTLSLSYHMNQNKYWLLCLCFVMFQIELPVCDIGSSWSLCFMIGKKISFRPLCEVPFCSATLITILICDWNF